MTRAKYKTWHYHGLPIPIRAWTWKNILCVRVLLFFGWPTWKAYDRARRWFG